MFICTLALLGSWKPLKHNRPIRDLVWMGSMPLKPADFRPLTPGLNLAHCLCQWQNNVFNKFPGRSYAAWKMHSFNMFICITDLSFGRVYYSLWTVILFPASNELLIRKGSQRHSGIKKPSSVWFSYFFLIVIFPLLLFPQWNNLNAGPKPSKIKVQEQINMRSYSDTWLVLSVLYALWLSSWCYVWFWNTL